MPEAKSTFLKKARIWAKEKDLHGTQAFLRYTMLNFVEALNRVSREFVFKGGNLLWLYIKTPRATVDLDFSTKRLNTHEAVRKTLEQACKEGGDGITYSLKAFAEVVQDGKRGAQVTIAYRTDEGAANTFGLDIVYAIRTEQTELPALIHDEPTIQAATIENIIADKLDASHRYKGGNTRLKDIDDLWRISESKTAIDWKRLAALLKDRSIPNRLDPEWIGPDLNRMWESHRRRYGDLPMDLTAAFQSINKWLRRLG